MTTIHRSQRGFVQILPLVLLAVFAITTVIITNNAKQQSNITQGQTSAACSTDKAWCGGCIAGCYSYAEIGSYGGGCQAMIDARCNQPPTAPPQPTQAPPNPPVCPIGQWQCNNYCADSETQQLFASVWCDAQARWMEEAGCGGPGSAPKSSGCGNGGTGGGTGGETVDHSATCASSGTTARVCYGVAVGAGCTGFNGRCVQNGGTTSDGYAVCGCYADIVPTQLPQATATSRPIESYCDTAIYLDCQQLGLRCIPDKDGGSCDETVPTRIPSRIPTATTGPVATRIPTATPTIRWVDRENLYNSPTPGIGSGYRCNNIHRGRCVGQGLVCDRAHFGQVDCASGNNCVPETALCRTPLAPTHTPRPTATIQKIPSRTPFPTLPPGYWITTPEVGRSRSSSPIPQPTVNPNAVDYCAVGASSFYRPCSECSGGPANVDYPFGETSTLRRCKNGYASGSTHQINSPTPTVRYTDDTDYYDRLGYAVFSPTPTRPTITPSPNAIVVISSPTINAVARAFRDFGGAISVLSCSVSNSLQVAFGGERVDCNSRFDH